MFRCFSLQNILTNRLIKSTLIEYFLIAPGFVYYLVMFNKHSQIHDPWDQHSLAIKVFGAVHAYIKGTDHLHLKGHIISGFICAFANHS